MVSIWEVLTVLAFFVTCLGLFAGYDLLVRKLIYHLYTPDFQLIFHPGDSEREDGTLRARIPESYEDDKILRIEFGTEREELSIPRKQLCYSEYTEDDTKFTITFANCGVRYLDVKAEIFADSRIRNSNEVADIPPDVGFGQLFEIQEMDHSESLLLGLMRKFDFKEFSLDPDMRRYYGWVIEDERVEGDPQRDYLVSVRVSVSIDASEFSVWRWNLPRNIGSVEYGPLEQKVIIRN